MEIEEHELEKMNALVESGEMISNVAKQFPKYDYWKIYWEVEDYSLLGKKRVITNRIKKLQKELKNSEHRKLVEEIKELVDEIYKTSKKNGKKLVKISSILAG